LVDFELSGKFRHSSNGPKFTRLLDESSDVNWNHEENTEKKIKFLYQKLGKYL
jgi:hypothetical protein